MFRKLLPIILITTFIVTGCSNKLVEEARKSTTNDNNKTETKAETDKKESEDLDAIYADMEAPINEVFTKNDFEKVNELVVEDGIELRDKYKDSKEFALFSANLLYNFQTREITPEAFYDFLKQYGSKSVQEGLQQDRDQAVTSYANVQEIYEQRKQQPKSYQISEVQETSDIREFYFYRKVVTTQEDEYYLTTIRKEKDHWTFVDDSPSPPYEAAKILDNKKVGEEDGTNN